MLVKQALDLINEESETMIIEWADTQDGFGVQVIEDALKGLFDEHRVRQEDRKAIKAQLKSLILLDMSISGW